VAQPARDPPGVPSLAIGGFQLWVHGRQFPDAEDRWDGNWLEITARCAASGVSVTVSGPVLDTVNLVTFRNELDALARVRAGSAELSSLEPNVRVAPGPRESELLVKVELTPEPIEQGHWFERPVSWSALPEALRQLDDLLVRVPVRGLPAPVPDEA
jgi:hypothetical protein